MRKLLNNEECCNQTPPSLWISTDESLDNKGKVSLLGDYSENEEQVNQMDEMLIEPMEYVEEEDIDILIEPHLNIKNEPIDSDHSFN